MFASPFQQQEEAFKKRKTLWAVLSTLLLHISIILILFFSILRTPIPPFEDNAGGMAVNFGFDAEGMGETQPFSYNPGPMENSQAAAQSSAPVTPASEETLTQDNEETDVSVPKVEDPKPVKKPETNALFKPTSKPANTTTTTTKATTTESPAPQPTTDPNALFTKGAFGKPNNSTGDGTGNKAGDQGKPDGDPNSKNYLGDGGFGDSPGAGGLGNGGFSLAGRKKVSLPAPTQCNSQGKVVVAIKVDKAGKVTEATFKRFASTVFDDCNVNNALNAARKATFNPDSNAPDVQEGTITYIYKVN